MARRYTPVLKVWVYASAGQLRRLPLLGDVAALPGLVDDPGDPLGARGRAVQDLVAHRIHS